MPSFDAASTAMDVAAASDLRGRTALVTGASSGFGFEAARALAAAGAELVLSVRDPMAGETIATRILEESGRPVHVMALDLTDLASVAGFADEVARRLPHLDIVVANAGVSKTPEDHTPAGLDVRFATNHLGHFALVTRLRRRLNLGARVVVVSSAAHKTRPLRFDDLQWKVRARDQLAAYGESKTANILFARELTRRWGADGVAANAVLPGSALTGLQRHHSDDLMRTIGFIQSDGTLNPVMRTPQQCAATIVWAATAPELRGRGGLILEDCTAAEAVGPDLHPWRGYDPDVIDDSAAERLWELSLTMVADADTSRGEAGRLKACAPEREPRPRACAS